MKIRSQNSNREHGTVLFVTLGICGVLGILIGSYLILIMTQRTSVSRAQAWNSALVVAEAGVEEAMAHINSGIGTNNLATNTWVSLGAGIVGKTNFLGTSYAVVQIQISPAVTNASPVILSTGYVPGPISSPALSRTVQITTKPRLTATSPGLVISTSIDFSGNGITTDSFDSSNTNYSTAALYDPAKASDHGDVTILSTNANSFQIGNGDIKGTAHTPPGGVINVTATVGSNGSVGDANWVNGGWQGFESGHFAADATFNPTDVTLPSVLLTAPAPLSAGKINGFNYKYKVDGSSTLWMMPKNLDNSLYVVGSNVLYVVGGVTIGSGMQIYIETNSSLTMYVAGASSSIGGNGVVNPGGLAQNFNYYGLPTNTSLGLAANADFIGSIYAPEADFTLGGGGSSYYKFIGQAVAQSLKMNGHFNFHFDEALRGGQAFNGYAASFWSEL